MGCIECSCKRKVYSYTGLPQVAGKAPNKQSKFIPKLTRDKGTSKTQSKEIIKWKFFKKENRKD